MQKNKADLSIPEEVDNYKTFAFGKNMFEVAIALVLATTFQEAVTSITNGLLMPIVTWFVDKTATDWRGVIFSPVEGINLEIGNLGSSLVRFLITSFVLFVIWRIFSQKSSRPGRRSKESGSCPKTDGSPSGSSS